MDPIAIAVDRAGYLYVINNLVGGSTSITVYAPGANGDDAPVQTIAGDNVKTGTALVVR